MTPARVVIQGTVRCASSTSNSPVAARTSLRSRSVRASAPSPRGYQTAQRPPVLLEVAAERGDQVGVAARLVRRIHEHEAARRDAQLLRAGVAVASLHRKVGAEAATSKLGERSCAFGVAFEEDAAVALAQRQGCQGRGPNDIFVRSRREIRAISA